MKNSCKSTVPRHLCILALAAIAIFSPYPVPAAGLYIVFIGFVLMLYYLTFDLFPAAILMGGIVAIIGSLIVGDLKFAFNTAIFAASIAVLVRSFAAIFF